MNSRSNNNKKAILTFLGAVPTLNTLRLELRLVRAYRKSTVTWKRFIPAACVSLEIDLPQLLNAGLRLDLEMLQLSKLVDFGVGKKKTKK